MRMSTIDYLRNTSFVLVASLIAILFLRYGPTPQKHNKANFNVMVIYGTDTLIIDTNGNLNLSKCKSTSSVYDETTGITTISFHKSIQR